MKKANKAGQKQEVGTMLSLSARKAQLASIVGLASIVLLCGYSIWTYWYYTNQLTTIQSQVETLILHKKSLEQQLLALTSKQIDLKQDISKNSEIIVTKNGEIQKLSSELKKAKSSLSHYKSQYWTLKSNYQNELNSALASERNKLAETQNALETELNKVEQQEAEISSKVSDISDWEKKKAEFDKLYANTALIAQNEERVSKLMGQFNQLRVDLDVLNECDKSYLYRYNEAKSILNHIRTFIQKYEMPQDYYFFVISNDTLLSAQNRKLCLVD